jgi:hypothetical protein
MKKIENMNKSKNREINEIYKELNKHPDLITFDIWDVDDIVERIAGDIKDVKFRDLVRKRTIKNKKVFKREISKLYDFIYYDYFHLTDIIDYSGFFDDIIESYPNYEEEKFK